MVFQSSDFTGEVTPGVYRRQAYDTSHTRLDICSITFHVMAVGKGFAFRDPGFKGGFSHVNLDKNLTSRILGFLFCKLEMMTVTTSPGHYIAGEAALSAVNSNTLAIFHAPIVYLARCWRVRADGVVGQAGQSE